MTMISLRDQRNSLRALVESATQKFDQIQSASIDISKLNTVCLALGPYRNLTTLTASLIALHPNCQVLNHAGNRVFAHSNLGFLTDYSDARFNAFARYAIQISSGGRRGAYGGSITLSHAFERDEIREAYESRFGKKRVKDEIHSLFWKESLKTSNLIRERGVDLGNIFQRNGKLRFLMPVRNPLDCAFSNHNRAGFKVLFEGVKPESDFADVLDHVLFEFEWFLDLSEQYPGRFFYYYENSLHRQGLIDLAGFLDVATDTQWVERCLVLNQVSSSYAFPPDIVDLYRQIVHRRFADHPAAEMQLLGFADETEARAADAPSI